jgi:hypothetical protein
MFKIIIIETSASSDHQRNAITIVYTSHVAITTYHILSQLDF